MFYNKYSNYSPEQIKNKSYESLGQKLLNIAKKEETKEKINSILYEGGYDDFAVDTGLTKNNAHLEGKKRIGYAYILASNPETFETMVQKNVNLFHGTNINALPNILKYGMQSIDEQNNNGNTPTTGERWSRIGGKRDFISFTDDIDLALDYASLNPSENTLNQEPFGVLIGISSESLKELKTCRVHSDLPEVGIMDYIPLEYIKTISVSEDKVEFVRKLVGDKQIEVTPIKINEKFYYVDPENGEISLDEKMIVDFFEKKEQSTENKIDCNQFKEVAESRRKSRITELYEKIKNIIKNKGKEKDYEEFSRDK